MQFESTPKTLQYLAKLNDFMKEHVYPMEKDYAHFVSTDTWSEYEPLTKLKEKAKAEKLWNLFLPPEYGDISPGLTNLEYAPLAEQMGKILWSSKVFNCAAPDTGNMEVLAKFGSDAQKEKWLTPLLAGKIRSAFLMTEPQVASSDATNIETIIRREGDGYVINGHKWWSTGAMHDDCKVFILMGKTDVSAERHVQQSMILIPKDTPGVEMVRPLKVFGTLHAPEGHCEIKLNNVRVPAENLIQQEGDGFRIAQGRLGPGRIHHCMRLIGCAQRALELMSKRVTERMTFGKEISSYSSIRQEIARSRCEIEQARLLTLSAADKIDREGIKGAKDLIAMIKIVTPRMAEKVIDRAIQMHGGMGVCEDTALPEMWGYARFVRIADGPDEVHEYQLGRNTIKKYSNLT